MGQAIVYCFKCQRRILAQEFEKGAAYQVGSHVTCSDCAARLLETLPPGEKEQLRAQMARPPSGSRPATGPPPSSTRIRAQKDRRKTTDHIPILRLPAAGGGASYAIVGGVIAGVILLILIVAVLAGGSKPPAPAPTPPRPRTSDDAPRLDAAQAALRKARQFARENPRDFPGLLRVYGEAVDAAEGTPLFEEARREMGELTLRRKEAVTAELADLDARLRPLLAAEEFKAAEILLEEAQKRREGPDWTPAVDAKLRQVREAAAKLFATLKAGAVDAPSRQALRDRLRKWGLPEFSIEPEAPVEERPWRSLLAKGLGSLRGQGYGGWRFEDGVLVKTEKDDAGQVNEEIGDGEIRVRFECENAHRVRFTLRQGGPDEAFEASHEQLAPGPHEIAFLCKGDAITATFDGRPLAVKQGKARRGLLQFNTAPPTSRLRILALDFRPLPP
ncbi:MAG TPA: hypothetical protein VF950_11370 [Planctomycetota bacterium]